VTLKPELGSLKVSAVQPFLGLAGHKVERRRREDRGTEGIEECGVWGGVCPSPLREGSWQGAVPLPRKFFDF